MCAVILVLLLLILVYLLNKNNIKENFTEQKLDLAVIVEPRKHKYLVPIILNFIKNLPKETKIQIFHGTENLDFIKKNLKKHIESGKIILTNLNVKNIDRHYYSNMFTNSEFWNKIDGENILIFQTDTCLCSKRLHNINHYVKMGYGYIGGPLRKNKDYQNGGFSLRRKSRMLAAIKTKKLNENTWPCDSWYSVKKKNIVKPAPYHIAKEFAIERVYSSNPFGVHKPWHFLNKNELDKLKKQCPEINEIFDK